MEQPAETEPMSHAEHVATMVALMLHLDATGCPGTSITDADEQASR
jgi:hypothetical protein